MEFLIGIYKALADGGATLEHIMAFGPMSYELAEKKVGHINKGLGIVMDDNGGFIPKEGEIYAMFDHEDDLSSVMVGNVVF